MQNKANQGAFKNRRLLGCDLDAVVIEVKEVVDEQGAKVRVCDQRVTIAHKIGLNLVARLCIIHWR